MWSSIIVPGPPRILFVDATQNIQGWEHEFSDRLYRSLQRSDLHLLGNRPLRVRSVTELNLNDFAFNCMILFAQAEPEFSLPRLQFELPPFLLAILSTPIFDLRMSEEVLKSVPAVAPMAIAPLSPMTPREAGLFYLKFFTELKLHSTDQISGKMVWFSFSKARELLRRRRYSAKFGIRC
jgi:hypothetical protein